MTLTVHPEELTRIAGACQASSTRLDEEAANMRTQLAQLEEAVQGIPQMAVADRFQQLNQMLSQLSTTLDESNTYIRGIVSRVEQFVAALQAGQ